MIVSLLPVPVMQTRMSAPPNSLAVAATSAAHPTAVATSPATETTRVSAAATSERAAASHSALHTAMTMFAPDLASTLAVANPMPTLPPVTTATLSRWPRPMISPPHYWPISFFNRLLVMAPATISTKPPTTVPAQCLPKLDERRGSHSQDRGTTNSGPVNQTGTAKFLNFQKQFLIGLSRCALPRTSMHRSPLSKAFNSVEITNGAFPCDSESHLSTTKRQKPITAFIYLLPNDLRLLIIFTIDQVLASLAFLSALLKFPINLSF